MDDVIPSQPEVARTASPLDGGREKEESGVHFKGRSGDGDGCVMKTIQSVCMYDERRVEEEGV